MLVIARDRLRPIPVPKLRPTEADKAGVIVFADGGMIRLGIRPTPLDTDLTRAGGTEPGLEQTPRRRSTPDG